MSDDTSHEDDVEAHAKRFHKSDPEQQKDPTAEKEEKEPTDSDRDVDDEPDVEAHAKRFH